MTSDGHYRSPPGTYPGGRGVTEVTGVWPSLQVAGRNHEQEGQPRVTRVTLPPSGGIKGIPAETLRPLVRKRPWQHHLPPRRSSLQNLLETLTDSEGPTSVSPSRRAGCEASMAWHRELAAELRIGDRRRRGDV